MREKILLALMLICSTMSANTATWNNLGDMGSGIYAIQGMDGNVFTGHFEGILGTYNNASKAYISLGDKGNRMQSMAVQDGNLFTGDITQILGTYNSTSRVWTNVKNCGAGNGLYSMEAYDGNVFSGHHTSGILSTYNPTSRAWNSLGDLGDGIYSLKTYDGNLYTGSTTGLLGTYKSGTWSSLGTICNSVNVYAMTVSDGNLFIGCTDGNMVTYNSTSRTASKIPMPNGYGGGWLAIKIIAYDGNIFVAQSDFNIWTYNALTQAITLIGKTTSSILSLTILDNNIYTGGFAGEIGTYGGLAPPTNTCSCPASGHWQINNGDVCTLSTECNLAGGDLHIANGSLNITSTGILAIPSGNKIIIAKGSKLYLEKGGKISIKK